MTPEEARSAAYTEDIEKFDPAMPHEFPKDPSLRWAYRNGWNAAFDRQQAHIEAQAALLRECTDALNDIRVEKIRELELLRESCAQDVPKNPNEG